MNNRRTWLWITALAVVVAVLLAVYYANHGGVSRNAMQAPIQGVAQLGHIAPEFTAATDKGYFDLATTSKPTFLEIFATWCPHCQRETAVIDRLYRHYKNRVAFVGVSGSNTGMSGVGPSSEEDVLNFVKALDVQYPVAYDGSLIVAHEYLQGGFPTLVVIAADKKISYITSGETPYGALSAALRKALSS